MSDKYRKQYSKEYELLKKKYNKVIKIRKIRELQNEKNELISNKEGLLLEENILNKFYATLAVFIAMVALFKDEDIDGIVLISIGIALLLIILTFIMWIFGGRELNSNLKNKGLKRKKFQYVNELVHRINKRIAEIDVKIDVLKDLLIEEDNFIM